MNHRGIALIVLTIALPGITAAEVSSDQWDAVDAHHEYDRHEEALAVLAELEGDISNELDRAEMLWRRARAEFSVIDLALYGGEISEDEAMNRLETIQEMAHEAVQIAGSSAPAQAYFWRGAARAKQGELRGVLNALFMADDLRDDLRQAVAADSEYGNPYYVAGQLYQRLPGFPVSFGDTPAAVSFSRRAVDLHDAAYDAGDAPVRYWDYYVRLAENLQSRGWSQRRRERRIPSMADDRAAADTAFERAMYYETEAGVPEQSDQEEAAALLQFVIAGLESQDELTVREERTLSDARELAR
ncbi:MAG: hypothetical protein ACOCYB_08805 [Alkalispirochaeta sp.]